MNRPATLIAPVIAAPGTAFIVGGTIGVRDALRAMRENTCAHPCWRPERWGEAKASITGSAGPARGPPGDAPTNPF
jgi:hypothetical protein